MIDELMALSAADAVANSDTIRVVLSRSTFEALRREVSKRWKGLPVEAVDGTLTLAASAGRIVVVECAS